VIVDETGDRKKGKTTDYVDRQYLGNLGKVAQVLVSVNVYAYGSQIAWPPMSRIFKPKEKLLPGDEYKSKPKIAVEMIKDLKKMGFNIKIILAIAFIGGK
jgi:SRSO17 transposase